MIWINLIISIFITIIGFIILLEGIDKHTELIKKNRSKAQNIYLLYGAIASTLIAFGAVKLADILIILF